MRENLTIEEIRFLARAREKLSQFQEDRRIEEATEVITNYIDRASEQDQQLLDNLKLNPAPNQKFNMPSNIDERICFILDLQENSHFQSFKIRAFDPTFVKVVVGLVSQTELFPYEVGCLNRAFKRFGKPVVLDFLPHPDTVYSRNGTPRTIIEHDSKVIMRSRENGNKFAKKVKPPRKLHTSTFWNTDDKDKEFPEVMILEDVDKNTVIPPMLFESFSPPFAATPEENRKLLTDCIAPYYGNPKGAEMLVYEQSKSLVSTLIERREQLVTSQVVKNVLNERGYHWEY